jgi:hypothetical protein
MFGIMPQVSAPHQPPAIEVKTMLEARVEVGFNYAVERVCSNVGHIDHAGDEAENVVWLAIHDVLVRAASEPDVTVSQLMLAFYKLAPEDMPRPAGVRR